MAKLDSQFSKFLDMLRKLHVNIPFLDALSQMPLYAKFLKGIPSNNNNDNNTSQCDPAYAGSEEIRI